MIEQKDKSRYYCYRKYLSVLIRLNLQADFMKKQDQALVIYTLYMFNNLPKCIEPNQFSKNVPILLHPQTYNSLLAQLADRKIQEEIQKFQKLTPQEYRGQVLRSLTVRQIFLWNFIRKLYYWKKSGVRQRKLQLFINNQLNSQQNKNRIQLSRPQGNIINQCLVVSDYSIGSLCGHRLTKAIPLMCVDKMEDGSSQKAMYRLKIAKLLVCILNEGGGYFIFGQSAKGGQKKKKSDQTDLQDHYFGNETRNIFNQLTLFYSNQSSEALAKVKNLFEQLSKQIYIGTSSAQFHFTVSPVTFTSQTSNPLQKNTGIFIKITPNHMNKPYFLLRLMKKNKTECSVFIRDMDGDICVIKGQQLYRYVQYFCRDEIKSWNHSDKEIEKRIRRAIGYGEKEYSAEPIFDYDLSMILMIDSMKKLSAFQRTLKRLQKNNIGYNICEPYTEFKGNVSDRIIFLNIDMRIAVFETELNKINFPLDLAFVLTGCMDGFFSRKNHKRQGEIIENLTKLLKTHLQNPKIKTIQGDHKQFRQRIFLEGRLEQILAFIYLQAQGCSVKFIDPQIEN